MKLLMRKNTKNNGSQSLKIDKKPDIHYIFER